MKTPICDFVSAYAAADPLRLHMPGHKGVPVLGAEPLDITEVPGADVLYDAQGVIAESEGIAAGLFGSGRTLYACEGSSLAVRAMLYLALLADGGGGARTLVLAGRNAHRSFLSAAALLDFDVEWLRPQPADSRLTCRVTPDALDARLAALPRRPAAVYVTSPDYLGHMVDVAGLSAVCRRYGVPLLVDNAHGAYLRFLPADAHPMTLGADMCCDSAHKTLPVLTGGAYLHISASAPPLFAENAARAMALFASTSPSYLILQSLDHANAYLADGCRARLAHCVRRLDDCRNRLRRQGFALVGDEPLKLTVAPKSYGYTGGALAALLRAQGIVCEFADPDYLVLMFTPALPASAFDRLEAALTALPRRAPISETPPAVPSPERVLTARQAMLAKTRLLPAERCLGRVLADFAVSCPPAVPIAVCGERLDEDALRAFRYYGVRHCRVVD